VLLALGVVPLEAQAAPWAKHSSLGPFVCVHARVWPAKQERLAP